MTCTHIVVLIHDSVCARPVFLQEIIITLTGRKALCSNFGVSIGIFAN